MTDPDFSSFTNRAMGPRTRYPVLIEKVPSNGLSGMTDERDKLSFTLGFSTTISELEKSRILETKERIGNSYGQPVQKNYATYG